MPEEVPPPTAAIDVPAVSGRSGISSIFSMPEMYHGRNLYPNPSLVINEDPSEGVEEEELEKDPTEHTNVDDDLGGNDCSEKAQAAVTTKKTSRRIRKSRSKDKDTRKETRSIVRSRSSSSDSEKLKKNEKLPSSASSSKTTTSTTRDQSNGTISSPPPPPPPPAAALPAVLDESYDKVIKDLRLRGLGDLASEILLRLPAIQEEEEKKKNNSQEKSIKKEEAAAASSTSYYIPRCATRGKQAESDEDSIDPASTSSTAAAAAKGIAVVGAEEESNLKLKSAERGQKLLGGPLAVEAKLRARMEEEKEKEKGKGEHYTPRGGTGGSSSASSSSDDPLAVAGSLAVEETKLRASDDPLAGQLAVEGKLRARMGSGEGEGHSRSLTNSGDRSARGEGGSGSGSSPAEAAGAVPPLQPALNSTPSAGTLTSNPGAYSVTPSGHFSTADYDSDLSLIEDDDDDDHDEDPSFCGDDDDIEQGRLSNQAGCHEDDNTSSAGGTTSNINNNSNHTTLEAVRVDDIMTVKAEPLARDSARLYKILAFVVLPLVTLVLILSITLGRKGSSASQTEPPLETYDEETRFTLIQNLLVHRLEPLYNLNYNITYGTQVLQAAFDTPSSPQYKALDWIARNDPEMQAIARPSLDSFMDHNLDTAVGPQDELLFDGTRQRRLLSEVANPELAAPAAASASPITHDRIVQRYALAVLFYATGSTNWTNSFEFLSNGPECDWSGAIQCVTSHQSSSSGAPDDDDNDDLSGGVNETAPVVVGAITHLDLHNNDLQGSIPLEIAALTHLKSLNLGRNKLVGTLPPALSTLTDLQHIDLGFNKKLSGTIPDAFYQSWSQLESWNMRECKMTGTIPPSVGNLSHLKEMLWNRNHLGGAIPRQFWSLTNMETMDFSQQKIRNQKFTNETISSEIGLWSNLYSFVWHGLELRGTIPTEVGRLTNLKTFQLANNHLSGTIPTELGALTAMTRLTLSINALEGTVPTEFIHMTTLRQLYLQNTLLTGDVGWICEAIDEGVLRPMDILRVNMKEVSGCYCCTCCLY